jgi:hypothetical protein
VDRGASRAAATSGAPFGPVTPRVKTTYLRASSRWHLDSVHQCGALPQQALPGLCRRICHGRAAAATAAEQTGRAQSTQPTAGLLACTAVPSWFQRGSAVPVLPLLVHRHHSLTVTRAALEPPAHERMGSAQSRALWAAVPLLPVPLIPVPVQELARALSLCILQCFVACAGAHMVRWSIVRGKCCDCPRLAVLRGIYTMHGIDEPTVWSRITIPCRVSIICFLLKYDAPSWTFRLEA